MIYITSIFPEASHSFYHKQVSMLPAYFAL